MFPNWIIYIQNLNFLPQALSMNVHVCGASAFHRECSQCAELQKAPRNIGADGERGTRSVTSTALCGQTAELL